MAFFGEGGSAAILFKVKADGSQAVQEFGKFRKEFKETESELKGRGSIMNQVFTSMTHEMGLTGQQAASLKNDLAQMGAIAGVVAGGVAALGAAAIGLGVALVKTAKDAAEWGSAIFDATEKTGASAEAVQALKYAAEQSGSSFEAVTGAVAKFNVVLGQAENGNKKAEATLKQYGITARDTDGALVQAIKTISDMDSSTQQAAAAQALFRDRSGEILPVIKSFDGDLAGLIQRLTDMGVIMSGENIRAADEFGDQMYQLDQQLKGVYHTIGFALIPVIGELTGEFSNFLTKNRTEIKGWAQWVADQVRFVIRQIDHLRLALVAAGKAAAGDFSGALAVITDQAAIEHFGDISGRVGLSSGLRLPRTDLTDTDTGGRRTGGGTRAAATGDTRTDRQVYNDFVRELAKLGVTITSGYRTFAQQAALFAKLPPGQAARPGTSDHEFFRAIDLPAGISEAVLEQAARAAGVVLGKELTHEGTGLHRHQPFRKGTPTGGGEESAFKDEQERQRQAEKDAEKERKLIADTFKARETFLDRELERFIEVKKTERAIAEGDLKRQLEIDDEILQKRIEVLTQMRAAAEGNAQKQAEIDDEIFKLQQERIRLSIDRVGEVKDAWVDVFETMKDAGKEAFEVIDNQASELASALRELARGKGKRIGRDKEPSIFDEWTGSFREFYDEVMSSGPEISEVLNTLANIGTDAFSGFANAIGNVVQQWVLYGETGPAMMRKILAAALASLAAEAAVRALWELALGFASLFFNPAEAAAHFTAAAIFGAVAGVAAVAGRAVAGDSFKRQPAAANSRQSASAARGTSDTSNQGQVYSSFGDKPQIVEQGRNAPGPGPLELKQTVRLEVVDPTGFFDKSFKLYLAKNGAMRSALREEIER